MSYLVIMLISWKYNFIFKPRCEILPNFPKVNKLKKNSSTVCVCDSGIVNVGHGEERGKCIDEAWILTGPFVLSQQGA